MKQAHANMIKISIILPCLNEEDAVEDCLNSIASVVEKNNINAEVIVVDNNSIDKTAEKVTKLLDHYPGLRLITAERNGYGSTLMKGFENAIGEYIYMADCDCTYDFNEIPNFIAKLDEGYDMVVGNRFAGKMESGAMPFHKKYIGNPVLSSITRLFFGIKIHDIHCGARAFKKDAYEKLSLYTTGMEFASEMIIKATKRKIKITEIPIKYKKRIGVSKLEAIGDGWRHLRFILLYSPLVLFLLPGILLFLVGLIFMGIFLLGNPEILGLKLFFHPMFLFSTMIIIGYQLIMFSMFAKIYAITHLGDNDPTFEKMFTIFTIEKAGITGSLFALIGSIIYGKIFFNWIHNDFGALNEIKNSIVALTFLTIGVQTFFSGFMLSTLGIKEK